MNREGNEQILMEAW